MFVCCSSQNITSTRGCAQSQCWQQWTLLNTRRHETSCHFYIKPCLLARPGPGPLQQLDSRPSVQLARVQLVSRDQQFLHNILSEICNYGFFPVNYNAFTFGYFWVTHPHLWPQRESSHKCLNFNATAVLQQIPRGCWTKKSSTYDIRFLGR